MTADTRHKTKSKKQHTVESLRKEGYRVAVMHERLEDANRNILPRGGTTLVLVSPPDRPSKTYFSFAYCSDKDNYNKKVGVSIALGRLMSGIKKGLGRCLNDTQVLNSEDGKLLRKLHDKFQEILNRQISKENKGGETVDS